jgi:CHASE1-domain containing sensor protein
LLDSLLQEQLWRTVLQPLAVIEEDSEEVSVTVAVGAEVIAAVAGAVVVAVEAAARRRRTGSL